MSAWRLAHRFDKAGARLADRHYNRRAVGSPQFVPPGANVVFVTEDDRAVWVTSAPIAAYVRHAWAGAWVNSLFRNEGAGLSSALITAAVAHSLWHFGSAPPLGIVSFVDPEKVRHKRDPGRCYRRAGWKLVGETQGGLLTFQLLPDAMPEAAPPLRSQTEIDFGMSGRFARWLPITASNPGRSPRA